MWMFFSTADLTESDHLIAWLEVHATHRSPGKQLFFDRNGWDIWANGNAVCACQHRGQTVELGTALDTLELQYPVRAIG